MRAALQLLFLVFYCASSYAVTHERTSYLISEWQHVASATQSQSEFRDSCKKARLGFPRYREAKKAGLDFDFCPSLNLVFVLRATVENWAIDVDLKPHLAVRPSAPRAPPA